MNKTLGKSCSPLEWEKEFIRILTDMDSQKMDTTDLKMAKTIAKYQTAIAAGGFLGLRIKQIRQLKWKDLLEAKDIITIESKTGENFQLSFSKQLRTIVETNYKMINPSSVDTLVLESPVKPGTALANRAFNDFFKKMLEYSKVKASNPSSDTLIKTFAYKLFRNKGGDIKALIFVSNLLKHGSLEYTRKWLGIPKVDSNTLVLNID